MTILVGIVTLSLLLKNSAYFDFVKQPIQKNYSNRILLIKLFN